MKSRGLLEDKKRGDFVYSKIRYPDILDVLDIVKKVKRKIGGKWK